jgi:hypothetical protein
MLNRCQNPRNIGFKNYGRRGVFVCKEWNIYENFKEWALANGYSDDLQIDRIDNGGNYCPENCRFVTPSVNSMNKRTNRLLTINGTTRCFAAWDRVFGISGRTHYMVKRYGLEEAVKRLANTL